MNRYVILTYTTIPRDTKVTHVKGWRDSPNATQYNESVAFKNNFPEDITYDKAFEYLKKHYPKYFTDA